MPRPLERASSSALGVDRGAVVGIDEPWGAALLDLAEAWCGDGSNEATITAAEAAADAFRRLGAGVSSRPGPGRWAPSRPRRRACPTRAAQAQAAEGLARASGSAAARLLAHAALARVDPVHADDHVRLATAAADETGLVLPPWASDGDESLSALIPDSSPRGWPAGPGSPGPPRGDPVEVRTLGGFALEVDGRRVSLDGVKPRARSLLRLLALHAGAPVHREVIQESLWPESDATAGARSLHVALSALRRLLDEEARSGWRQAHRP